MTWSPPSRRICRCTALESTAVQITFARKLSTPLISPPIHTIHGILRNPIRDPLDTTQSVRCHQAVNGPIHRQHPAAAAPPPSASPPSEKTFTSFLSLTHVSFFFITTTSVQTFQIPHFIYPSHAYILTRPDEHDWCYGLIISFLILGAWTRRFRKTGNKTWHGPKEHGRLFLFPGFYYIRRANFNRRKLVMDYFSGVLASSHGLQYSLALFWRRWAATRIRPCVFWRAMSLRSLQISSTAVAFRLGPVLGHSLLFAGAWTKSAASVATRSTNTCYRYCKLSIVRVFSFLFVAMQSMFPMSPT